LLIEARQIYIYIHTHIYVYTYIYIYIYISTLFSSIFCEVGGNECWVMR